MVMAHTAIVFWNWQTVDSRPQFWWILAKPYLPRSKSICLKIWWGCSMIFGDYPCKISVSLWRVWHGAGVLPCVCDKTRLHGQTTRVRARVRGSMLEHSWPHSTGACLGIWSCAQALTGTCSVSAWAHGLDAVHFIARSIFLWSTSDWLKILHGPSLACIEDCHNSFLLFENLKGVQIIP